MPRKQKKDVVEKKRAAAPAHVDAALKLNADGTVRWEGGSLVEVTLHGEDMRDPNMYYARCLTTGTFPRIQVLDEKYPEPLEGREVAPLYVIWRLVPEEEAKVVSGEAALPSGKTYVVNLVPGGAVQVLDSRKRKNKLVDTFRSIESAEAWICDHECSACGRPVTEPSKSCPVRHFGDVDKPFSF
jgi:hypothetical protein